MAGPATRPRIVILAAGHGRRMGADKALMPVGGVSCLERILTTITAVCSDPDVVVVRSPDHDLDGLPAGGHLPTYRVAQARGEMIDSVCAALDLPGGEGAAPEGFLVWPVDMPLIAATDVAAVLFALQQGAAIAAPTAPAQGGTAHGRLGHPFGFAPALAAEVQDAAARGGSLRDLLQRDPARVVRIPSGNPWVRRDLDVPAEREAAEAMLAASGLRPVTEWMRAHRSRRAFAQDPIPPEQLHRLVDAARHASTSSFIQASSVVVVRDPERKARCAALCSDQKHIHGAPLFLAICADLDRIGKACRQHGEVFQHGNLEVFLQATVDAALLGQNLLLAAESEGLGGCMIGAARNHPVALARELGLPPHCFAVFGMVLGVPEDDPVPRERMPLDGVLHRECHDSAAAEAAVQAADEQMQGWARSVNARITDPEARRVREDKGWSDRMAVLWGEGSRYLAERGGLLGELQALGLLQDLAEQLAGPGRATGPG